jgi:hypothetical protein
MINLPTLSDPPFAKAEQWNAADLRLFQEICKGCISAPFADMNAPVGAIRIVWTGIETGRTVGEDQGSVLECVLGLPRLTLRREHHGNSTRA